MLTAAFVFLAIFTAGGMTVLQLQHYAIYPAVGRESFAAYLQANNRAATIPSVAPAVALLIVSVALVITRPGTMSLAEGAGALGLNLVALASTFSWQRALQEEMARDGYDEGKVRKLVATNWLRTGAYGVQAVLAIVVVLRRM